MNAALYWSECHNRKILFQPLSKTGPLEPYKREPLNLQMRRCGERRVSGHGAINNGEGWRTRVGEANEGTPRQENVPRHVACRTVKV